MLCLNVFYYPLEHGSTALATMTISRAHRIKIADLCLFSIPFPLQHQEPPRPLHRPRSSPLLVVCETLVLFVHVYSRPQVARYTFIQLLSISSIAFEGQS